MEAPDRSAGAAEAFHQTSGQVDARPARVLLGWRMGDHLVDLLWEFPWFRRLLARLMLR